MKLALLLAAVIAAAATAAVTSTGADTNPAATQKHQHAVHVHRVAAAQVRAVEEIRRTVWACQRAIEAPARRAVLDHQELRQAGWRFLIWVKQQWRTTLTECRATQAKRDGIIRRVAAGLHGYPLEPWAKEFERAGRHWNISPYFMAAISGLESTYGLYVTPGNAWGIGPGISYANFGEGVWALAKLLATSYDLTSTYTVGPRYCCPYWGGTVGSIMQSRFGASPYALRYPG